MKEDLLRRVKEKGASAVAYEPFLAAETREELARAIVDSFAWCYRRGAVDATYLTEKFGDLLERVGVFTGEGRAATAATAIGSARVFANDSATVTAFDSAKIWAFDSAEVIARGEATVEARGEATVIALDSATVEANHSAEVAARDSATVEAFDSAEVWANGSAKVEAFDRATVRAYGSAEVIARDSATVKLFDRATVEAYGDAYVENYTGREISPLSDRAIVKDIRIEEAGGELSEEDKAKKSVNDPE